MTNTTMEFYFILFFKYKQQDFTNLFVNLLFLTQSVYLGRPFLYFPNGPFLQISIFIYIHTLLELKEPQRSLSTMSSFSGLEK